MTEREHNPSKVKKGLASAGSFFIKHQYGIYGTGFGGAAIDLLATGNPTFAALLGGTSLVCFTTEGVQQFFGGMNKRIASARNLTPSSEELKRFRTEPNPAADLLEEYLGLRFENKPLRAKYDFRNRQVHRRIDPLDAALTRKLLNGNKVGVYESRYNIYFARVNSGLMTDLHEGAHGLVHQYNSEFGTVNQRYNHAAREGESLPDEDVEKYMTLQVFNEGMAEWMEFTTALRYSHENREDEEKHRAIWKMIVMSVDKDIFTIPTDQQTDVPFYLTPFLEKDKETLTQAKELYANALLHSEKKLSAVVLQTRLRQRANKLLEKDQYRIGANFVSQGVSELGDAGMELSDSLITLIQNPPSTIDELLEPRRYVREKILGEQIED